MVCKGGASGLILYIYFCSEVTISLELGGAGGKKRRRYSANVA